MANEYLQRTPTSTGNRKVWTWSAWIKRNQIARESYFSAGNSTSSSFGIDYDNSNLSSPWIYDYTSGFDWQIKATQQLRDTGNFFHYLLTYNTTESTSSDRVNIYINGSQISSFSTETYPSANFEGYVNDLVRHTIGAYMTPSLYSKAEITDVFFVDGQALTPDVFGFYKDGNGYISAGSTQATDFRPGQWVPKTPRIIKTEINRRGGFGVNGFYLPMNDSSNFGADFHTTPNSIITLKGEDLPQPRNGAPTTTDAYVSQLREDPYAANLVLAVPGISTATGPNLITNGTFENGLTGWTTNNEGSGTSTVSNNQLVLYTPTTSSEEGRVYQQISVTSGKRYTVSFYTSSSTLLQVSNTIGGYEVANQSYGAGQANLSFTATASNHYIELRRFQAGTSIIDNVVVREEDAPGDYSADIKGSGTNKTLTANGNAGVGYEIPSYYGSALSFDGSGDYLSIPDSDDFNFGSGDFTVEAWIKGATGGTKVQSVVLNQSIGNAASDSAFYFGAGNDGTSLYLSTSGNSWTDYIASSVEVDNDGWNHLVWQRRGSLLELYTNGVCVGTGNFTGTVYNSTREVEIGRQSTSGSNFNGYIQDLRVYKGLAKYKGGFDVPKPYTPVGIATWRAVSDTTANNFATLNPLSNGNAANSGGVQISYTNGNNTATWSAGSNNATFGTVGINTGRWYWEGRLSTVGGSFPFIGISSQSGINNCVANANNGIAAGNNGVWLGNGGLSADDIVGVAVSFTSAGVGSTITFFINNTAVTNINHIGNRSLFDGQTNTWIPSVSGVNGCVWDFNFGQNPTFSGSTTAGTYTDSNGKGLFKYEPPSGFLALCEDNLPTPAIKNPGEYFKTVLYTGDGNNGRSITGIGFTPDLVWIKGRGSAAYNNHLLYDSVRGTTKILQSNQTADEATATTGLSSFDSDGFTIGTFEDGNTNANTYVAWCWRAGAGTTSTNTDGSIQSVVSVNQDAGFSIVSYTGTGSAGTVGHGLGKNPGMIIIKSRDSADTWPVWHKSLSSATDNFLQLEKTVGVATISNYWNSSAPNTTTFGLAGGSYAHNLSGDGMIAYCWAEIENFSKFGSFVGNGDADGPAVYCGFKPAFVLIKEASGTDNWAIKSNHISTNPNDFTLLADRSDTEYGPNNTVIDLVSNGFKIRTTSGLVNTSGATYIFAAFAESPFTTANAK